MVSIKPCTVVLIFCLLFISCRSFKDTGNDKVTPLVKSNLSILNGTYANVAVYDSTDYSGWSLWTSIFEEPSYLENWQNCTVELKTKNNRAIKAKLLLNNKVIKERVIHGKIKNGYFYRRPVFFLVPFFPVLGGYKHSRSRISIANEYIIADKKLYGIGMFLGFGGEQNHNHRSRFLKK